MTAKEVKDGLRGRHPAFAEIGLGPWTVLEEFANIDLLAFSAWSSKKPQIIGYEVKVSRSDYRRELLNPSKRAGAVAGCWSFYMATPKGLLTKEEKAYVEPEHFKDGGAFVREPCPAHCERASRARWRGEPGTTKSGRWTQIEVGYGDAASSLHGFFRNLGRDKVLAREEFDPAEDTNGACRASYRWDVCDTCEGRGYLRQSVVEQGAPTLWIPNDVGLVEVDDAGKCRTVRKAPVSRPTEELGPIGRLVRWSSFRPDPRHAQNANAEVPS